MCSTTCWRDVVGSVRQTVADDEPVADEVEVRVVPSVQEPGSVGTGVGSSRGVDGVSNHA